MGWREEELSVRKGKGCSYITLWFLEPELGQKWLLTPSGTWLMWVPPKAISSNRCLYRGPACQWNVGWTIALEQRLNVHTTRWRILFKCRFWFCSSGVGPETLISSKLPGHLWSTLGSKSLQGSGSQSGLPSVITWRVLGNSCVQAPPPELGWNWCEAPGRLKLPTKADIHYSGRASKEGCGARQGSGGGSQVGFPLLQ